MNDHDKILRKNIIQYFKQHTEIDSARVEVEVDGNIVTLSGKVNGPVAKAELEAFASVVQGAEVIINKLEVDSENLSGVQGISIR